MNLPEKLRKSKLVTLAFEFSQKAHTGQKRDSGEEYIVHPYRVCISLFEEFGIEDENLLAAGLLHDVIEDSSTSHEQLSKLFNERVANLVDAVTKKKDSTDPKWKEKYYKNIQNSDEQIQLLKFVDRLDNIRDLISCPSKEKQIRYLKETKELFLPWAKKFNEKVYEKLVQEIEKIEVST
ncbi:HD domain-containing protein [Candidatus Micrarchaeota archaeon]|nr:HD domain-containing protein [Candidatus Micrarchaeota archaeon]